MNRCPLTYLDCGDKRYSLKGLKLLDRRLDSLKEFPYTREEQLMEAASRAIKMSIPGVQPKLSARLNIKERVFEIVDIKGKYILKPQNHFYPQLPENEDLTMRLAETVGIEVPIHGVIYSKDESLTYFIKRFDRFGRNKKLPLEDFAQLAGKTRDTKYDYSMEKLVDLLEKYSTFPAIEKIKLFRITVFNFLIGNEDMHLKNFSVINQEDKIELSPSYDLINTTIAIKNPQEEIALPLKEKKRKLTANDLIIYFGKERLGLNEKIISGTLKKITSSFTEWESLIEKSFLSDEMKNKYFSVIASRKNIVGF